MISRFNIIFYIHYYSLYRSYLKCLAPITRIVLSLVDVMILLIFLTSSRHNYSHAITKRQNILDQSFRVHRPLITMTLVLSLITLCYSHLIIDLLALLPAGPRKSLLINHCNLFFSFNKLEFYTDEFSYR